jgi:hypothetical protein
MADNGKKEFPQSGIEEDENNKFTRRIYSFIHNSKGVTKYVKRSMNKRFRKRNKPNKRTYE